MLTSQFSTKMLDLITVLFNTVLKTDHKIVVFYHNSLKNSMGNRKKMLTFYHNCFQYSTEKRSKMVTFCHNFFHYNIENRINDVDILSQLFNAVRITEKDVDILSLLSSMQY